MGNIIPFNYKSNQIRVINKGGEPWFVADEVIEADGDVFEAEVMTEETTEA